MPEMEASNIQPKASNMKSAIAVVKVIAAPAGFILLLVVYCIIGAILFKAVEGPLEVREKYNIVEMRENVVQNLWNTTLHAKKRQKDFEAQVRDELRKYEALLHTAFSHGINSDSEKITWDFWGALIYCTTIFTTVGYGHIYPVSTTGRLATIIYALIGIPLCLICLAELGKLFTLILKYTWSKMRGVFSPKHRASPTEKVETPRHPDDGYTIDSEFNFSPLVALAVTIIYIFLGAVMYMQWEDWNYVEAFYFVFISVSTIGFGDVLPSDKESFLLSFLYQLFGLAIVALLLNVLVEVVNNGISFAINSIAHLCVLITRKITAPIAKLQESMLGKQKKKD